MIRRKKDSMKAPSTWSRLSWPERVVMYGGPILIIWICYMIYDGMIMRNIKPDVKETHIEEMSNE
jgi:hypothetical protein